MDWWTCRLVHSCIRGLVDSWTWTRGPVDCEHSYGYIPVHIWPLQHLHEYSEIVQIIAVDSKIAAVFERDFPWF